MITQKINLNLIPNGVMPRVNVSQYDYGSRTLEITLYNGSTLFSIPNGAQIVMQGTKKDNRGFQYVDLDYTGSVVTADITQQMTVFEDEVHVELVIITGSGDNKQQLATANFILNVEAAALKDDIVVSETDIPAIQTLPEAMAQVNYAVELLDVAIPAVEADVEDAEAWAKGTKNGNPVASTDPQYHNNSKYYSEQASASAESVGATASNSEAYAVGKRNGVDVGSDDPAYHNNSKYYSEQAGISATSATQSASNASTSASNAATSESNASTSATNASASENNAENYSLDSQSWAEGKRGNTDVPNTDPSYHNNAKYYSEQASSSATNAATSASNAAISETNASSSASSALTSATNAATSETNAAASESSASASASNAATSATNAATSESNAATSESNASTSAINAANSETNAATSKSDSEAYAVETRNGQQITDTTDPAYHNSAKFWAGQAQQAAGGGVISFNGRSGAVEPQSGDYNKSMVGLGNVDNTADLNKPISTAAQIALDAKAPKSDIAPSETSPTTHAYKVGDMFYYNGTLYKAKTSIAVGDTLIVNTNIETTSVSATSGGHVIIDESGVLYTQRSKLKFLDSVITDDAQNDTTIVQPQSGTTIVTPPTVTVGTYTYDGTAQGPTIVWATGMADNCVVTNATSTNAGTYTLTIALKNTAKMIWTDMTTADKTWTYTISPKSLTVPTVTGSYTYNGSEKSAVISVFDPTEITQGGTSSATNAGTYTVTFDLKNGNFVWSDTTTLQKTGTWTIAKASLTVPTVDDTGLIYNGTAQSPTITGFDSTLMTKSGDSATNAGDYTVSFGLVDSDNYQWNSSTTSFAWNIAKATSAITVSSASVSPTRDSPTKTVTVGNQLGRTLSVSSSNTSIATASISGTTVTITGLQKGSATVTVSAAESANYTASSKTIAVTVNIYKTMTIIIDQSNSNPATCCTYYDDAVGMTAGSSAWDDFFGQTPVLLDSSGNELGNLKVSDYSKYENGTSAPITTVGNDVMVKFPKRGLKISTSGNTVSISMTDDPDAESKGFKYYAHSYGANNNCDAVYVGAYKGYVSSSRLYSSSGKTPIVNETIGTFRTYANARGTGYEQMTFYVKTFLVAAYLLKYKNLNSQVAVGRGYVDGNSAPTTTGQTNAKGMDWGESTGKYQCKLLGVEDLWGNINEWIDGICTNSTYNILTKTTNNSMNDTGSGYTDQGRGATAYISNYIDKVVGTTEKGFIVKSGSGSATTYFCDIGEFYGEEIAYAGGHHNGINYAGIFLCNLSSSASGAYATVGGRLIKFKIS